MKTSKEPKTKTHVDSSANERVDTTHHHFRIIAGQQNGTCQAIAYLGRRKFGEAAAETVSAAVETLKRVLDDHHSATRRERRDDVPTVKEFREALAVLESELPAGIFTLLRSHARFTNASAFIDELAKIGTGNEATMLAGYTRLGRRLAALLEFSPAAPGWERALAYMHSFALLEMLPGRTTAVLRLRPQLVAALTRQGSHNEGGSAPSRAVLGDAAA